MLAMCVVYEDSLPSVTYSCGVTFIAVAIPVARTDAADPLVVGVDPGGFDVRRQFDIIRLNAPEGRVISDEASAISLLTALAKEA